MAQQHPGVGVGGGGGGLSISQFGDTTLTKVFVGGLAWETQCETMRRYFEQFGDILEAVVIKDKNTGRSKGYGFVTFRDAEAARRACVDAAPVIDGRRANCNLASLGAHRPRLSPPLHGGRYRAPGSPYSGGAGAHAGGVPSYGGSPTFGQPLPFAYQQGFPYPPYGYPPYLPEYYSPNIYNPFMGPQFPAMYGGPAPLGSPTMYPHPLSPPVQAPPPAQPGYGIPAPTAQQLLPYVTGQGATFANFPQYGAMLPIPAHGHSPGPMSPAAGPGRSPPHFVLPAPSPQSFTPGGGTEQQSG